MPFDRLREEQSLRNLAVSWLICIVQVDVATSSQLGKTGQEAPISAITIDDGQIEILLYTA